MGPAKGRCLPEARHWPVWTAVAAALVFALDRVTKFWVSHALFPGQQLWPSLPIHIYYAENRGAAFSLLPNAQWLFLVVAVVVVVAIAARWRPLSGEPWWVQAGVGMVLGGAVGNALDRITQGYVVDFMQLPHWPVFNVADSGVTVGMVIVVIRIALGGRGDA